MPALRHTEMPMNRSYLFVPASRPERLPKAFASGADAVVADWEDALADHETEVARAALHHYCGPALWLRIKGAAHPEHAADLQAAAGLSGKLCGILLPKAEQPDDISRVAHALGLPVIAAVESAAGWLNLPRLAAADGLHALSYGCLDICRALGANHGSPAAEVLLDRLRTDLLLHSAANSLRPPIDSIFPDFRNEHGLRRYVGHWRDMGFGGMLCIHPQQIAAVHSSLKPSPEQLDFARRVCETAAQHRNAVFQLDGKMVDLPLIEHCQILWQRYGNEQ